MNKTIYTIITLSSLIILNYLLQTSCSIKEDRYKCPKELVLDFSKITNGTELLLNLEDGKGEKIKERITISDSCKQYKKVVPQGTTYVSIITDDKGKIPQNIGNEIVTTKGMDFPPIYAYWFNKANIIDRHIDTVKLCKCYCKINITIQNPEKIGGKNLGVEITSSYIGYNTKGECIEGDFSYLINPKENVNSYSVCVPRQKDSNMQLTIFGENGIIRSFALGEYIKQTHYDWEKQELEDIDIKINCSEHYVNIDINLWDKTLNYDIAI